VTTTSGATSEASISAVTPNNATMQHSTADRSGDRSDSAFENDPSDDIRPTRALQTFNSDNTATNSKDNSKDEAIEIPAPISDKSKMAVFALLKGRNLLLWVIAIVSGMGGFIFGYESAVIGGKSDFP